MKGCLEKYKVEKKEVGDEIQLMEEMNLPIQRCFRCNSFLVDFYKSCRYTKQRGKVETHICLICGTVNTIKDLDFRMQHNKKDILKFIELRCNGWTPYRIVSHNKLKIGMMTAFRWEKKYSDLITPSEANKNA